jgi:hemerythrin superfamily protein
MGDAAQLLKQDHRKVEELFDRYGNGDDAVVPKICNELTIHSTIEEEVLYPVLPEIPGGEELRSEAEREHQDVKDAIAEVERSGYESAAAAAAMRKIMEGVTHHVEEEEQKVLPKMEKALGPERMNALGEQLLEAKREKLVATGVIAELTKDELYELAQGAQVEGRSEMNKEQLIEALSA